MFLLRLTIALPIILGANQSIANYHTLHKEMSPKREINTTIDNFMDLVRAFDNLTNNLTNIYQIEKRGLTSVKLTHPYWSYHSLPLYKGGTANRYNDEDFSNLDSWEKRYNSYLKKPVGNFIGNGTIHKLSPLEKYELLIGKNNFSLTANEWSKGKEYIDRTGRIARWIGACHGTAPASISHTRPTKEISVLADDGKTIIVFYPSDIKALLAFSWDTNGGPSAVMGSRCYLLKNNNKSCNDTNPGSFHLAITNLMGIHKRPLLMDTDSGPQVWNRPVIGYQLSYFNPQFRNYTRLISNAIIDISKYPNDPYRQYRAVGTKKLIGVRAEIELVADTEANSDPTDHISNDKTFNMVFTYDLELDEFGEILGGMWHGPIFPDFVWVVSPQNLPLSRSERWFTNNIPVDSRLTSLPLDLKNLAIESRKVDQVSFWAIDYLLRKSTK